MQTWRLDDGRQTLVLAACAGRLPESVYWSAPLPADADCEALARAGRIDVTGGMLDENPDLSICPEAARSFPGQPGLVVRDEGGELLRPSLRLVREERSGDGGRLALVFADASVGLAYTARFATDRTTFVMTLQASLEAERPVRLGWLAAPVLPAPPARRRDHRLQRTLVRRASRERHPVDARDPVPREPHGPERA